MTINEKLMLNKEMCSVGEATMKATSYFTLEAVEQQQSCPREESSSVN